MVENLRVLQCICVLNGEPGDVVEDHVHDADGPDGTVRVLSVEGEVVGIFTLFLHVLVALDKKAAGAYCGVVDFIARAGFHDLDQQTDDFAGGIELAALFAGAVGEELDQVFVGCAEEIRELEVVVDQYELGLVEVVEQVFPFLVGDFGLPLHSVEIDVVFQHAGKSIVLVFHGRDGFIEHVSDVLLEILEGGNLVAVFILPGLMPTSTDRDEESLAVGCLVFEQLFLESGVGDVGEVLLAEMLALAVKLVRQTLDEEQAKDKFLELRGIHLAAKNVSGLEKEAFKLGERDFFAGHEMLDALITLGRY